MGLVGKGSPKDAPVAKQKRNEIRNFHKIQREKKSVKNISKNPYRKEKLIKTISKNPNRKEINSDTWETIQNDM